MTPDSPKGPENTARAYSVVELRDRVAQLRASEANVRAALRVSDEGLIQFRALSVRQHRDCLRELLRGMARRSSEHRRMAFDLVKYLDQKDAEVSRLREQLAAQPKVPVDADELISVALNAATNRCNAALSESLDIALTGSVMDLLKSWGVSSSEVEAPRPKHVVELRPVWRGVGHARCLTCGEQSRDGIESYVQDWADRYVADTLVPQVGGVVKRDTLNGKENGAETFLPQEPGPPGFVLPQKDAGRPSGSERRAPHPGEEWCEKCDNFVSGSHYHCAKCGQRSGMLGHSMRPCPTKTPGDAAQAARSEATPKTWQEGERAARNGHLGRIVKVGSVTVPWVFQYDDGTYEDFYNTQSLTEVPSPSLRKEGEDTVPASRRPVHAHPDYDYEYGEEGERIGINAGWDLAFGCRVSFSLDEGEPYVVVSMSDRELRDGSCNRSVTREQIRGFAYYLIQMTEEMHEFSPSVSSQEEKKEGETDG